MTDQWESRTQNTLANEELGNVGTAAMTAQAHMFPHSTLPTHLLSGSLHALTHVAANFTALTHVAVNFTTLTNVAANFGFVYFS